LVVRHDARHRWPQVEIIRTGMRDHYGISLKEFPAPLQVEVEQFLTGSPVDPQAGSDGGNLFRRLAAQARERVANAATPHKAAANTKPQSPRSGRRALSPRTVQTRRDQIKLAATALVLSGVPIETVTSLAVLVSPLDHAVTILDFHRERLRQRMIQAGENPAEDDLRNSTIAGIGEMLRQIGKFAAKLPDAEMEELNGLLSLVRPEQQVTMTEKNRVRLKALLADPAYSMLLHTPRQWLEKDAADPELKPRDAVLIAMYAVALEVFLMLPLRRANLLQLRLDVHLIRPAGGGFITEIFIPAKMVKNRVPIHWPVGRESARLLDIYIKRHRPLLAPEGNAFLFPGIGDRHRDEAEFASTLSERVEREIGAEFNCHLARHFAVVRYLRANPGAYEIAAQILGHKNPETTRRFYCGLEQDAAARHVNAVLTQDRQQTKMVALGAFHRPRRRKAGGRG
jgi:integrase